MELHRDLGGFLLDHLNLIFPSVSCPDISDHLREEEEEEEGERRVPQEFLPLKMRGASF